jgi:peptidoglycan/LPS O-acetylase OafA/YrhL
LTSNSSLIVLLLDMPPSLPLPFPDWPPISLGWLSFVLWLAHIVAFISLGQALISALVSMMATTCSNSTIIISCVGSNQIPTNPIPHVTPYATI